MTDSGEPGAPTSPRSRAKSLGHDPLETPGDPAVLDAWLAAYERVAGGTAPASREASDEASLTAALAPPEIGRLSRTLEWLVDAHARRRLEALVTARAEAGLYDPFGLSGTVLRKAFPLFYALHRLYFRVASEGHENIPAGPVLLAANHGGLLPFDGAMAVVDLLLRGEPPRLLRALVDRWAVRLPYVNIFFARVGQVAASRANLAALLARGELVLVFPEGIEGIAKPIYRRERLARFHAGFVTEALRARAPIVPTAVLGSENQAPILYDLKSLARRVGLPTFPITPTFPWLGPLGLVPYPVRYRIVYGEPLYLHERYDPKAVESREGAQAVAGEVREALQRLLDRHR